MIPQEILNMLANTKPLIGHIGTRAKDLKTAEIMTWGIKADPEKSTITVLIPTAISERTLSNLQDNKRVAFLMSEPMSHECYQLKGEYVSHNDSSEDDQKLADEFINRFYDQFLKLFGAPPEAIHIIGHRPGTTITFKVEDVFVQTPGPNAGSKL